MAWIHQTNGVTDCYCKNAAPEPNDGTWIEVNDNDPRTEVVFNVPQAPTKAELLAQIQALTAKVEALP